nr:TonB-dependent receptor [candidate division Zixibacteria bacterium]
MYTNNRLLPIYAILILLLILPVLAAAGTTGKIAGVVEDEKTGTPIPGATIRVIGSDIVTESDNDGDYFILNLPAGTYTLAVSVIGFQTIEKENVRVLLDLTTPVDFTLEQVEIPLKRQVKVYAERNPIQKDLTESRLIMTSDRLMYIPGARSIQNILANMAGTIVDRNQDLHVRGGRSGTVSYFYDGFSIQDPFAGESGIRIIPDAIEEISLTSGGFPAEYGEALSGIVNAVTREGTREFHGMLKVYDGASNKYDIGTGEFGSLERIKDNAASYNLSGPLPDLLGNRSSFFMAGEYRHDGGYLPHNILNQYTQSGKLTFQPTPNMKVTATGSYFQGDRQVYEHLDVNGLSYDFNLDGLGITKSWAYLYGLKGNYNVNERSIVGLSVNHFYTETKRAPEDLFDTYWNEWPGYSEDSTGAYNGTIHEDNYRFAEEYFNTGYTTGDDFMPIYHRRYTSYNAVALNFTSQINKYHQVRIGSEYRDYTIFWDEKQFFNSSPYGEKYKHSPTYATVYAQDKLELREFIINAGIRWDYLNSEVEYWPDILNKDTVDKVKSKSKSQISPRLGVSHPISENSVIRFNYGYFFQVPNYRYMYTNQDVDLNSGLPLVGNPDLEAEKTIAYELGLNQMLSPEIRLDITVYYKDIKDLIATRPLYKKGNPNPITLYVNEDYGSVKGMDLTIEKIARGYFSGSLVYSYMIAKGNSSSATEAYYSYIANTTDTVLPTKEYPLSFDQRHTATLSLDYRVPREWKGKFMGINVPGAWGINAVAHYGSGLPYTITDNSGNRYGSTNEGRMPSTYTVDFRFNKDVFVSGGNFFSFFVEVENLFDKRNIINVYTNTGRPNDDGRHYDETADPDGTGPYTAEDVNHYYKLLANDPQNYSSPRRVRVGLEFNF